MSVFWFLYFLHVSSCEIIDFCLMMDRWWSNDKALGYQLEFHNIIPGLIFAIWCPFRLGVLEVILRIQRPPSEVLTTLRGAWFMTNFRMS